MGDVYEDFLRRCGVEPGPLQALANDASVRRYFRIHGAGRPLLLMDMGGLDARPYLRIAGHLRHLGFRVPLIHDSDPERGLVLLEDLGDATFTRLLAAGEDEHGLYELAIGQLIRLHGLPEAVEVEAPRYDEPILLEEAGRLVLWLFPLLRGRAASREEQDSYQEAWRKVLRALPESHTTLVLVDFHVDNLMRLDDGDCALLDFQDARIGPAAYDVMSLLEDARRDVSPAVVEAMLARYRASRPAVERGAFDRWYAVLGAQRHSKVAGLFVRLCLRDGKCRYLEHIPRVLRRLERHLQRSELQPVRDWLDHHLPQRLAPVPEFDPQELRLRLDLA